MNFYENYIALCNSVGKTPSAVALEMGLSKPTVNRWKNGGGVTDATAAKVAEYFDVPVGVLTGAFDKNTFSDNLSYYIGLHMFETPETIATKTGIAGSLFDEWLACQSYPSIRDLEKLANFFGILIDDLIKKRPQEREEYIRPVWMNDDDYFAMCKYKGLSPAQKKIICDTMDNFLLGNSYSVEE